MKKLVPDLKGKRFGRYYVICFDKVKHETKHWYCLCECGKVRSVSGYLLFTGQTKSCRCLNIANHTKHGKSDSSEYKTWRAMIERCYDKRNGSFADYGGRGITVCDRWKNSFENFLEDMGMKEGDKNTIERINVNGNYEPSNCLWASIKDQARNKRKFKNNKSGCPGVSYYRRLNKWRVEIGINNSKKSLGYFLELDDAIKARKDAEIKYWGIPS